MPEPRVGPLAFRPDPSPKPDRFGFFPRALLLFLVGFLLHAVPGEAQEPPHQVQVTPPGEVVELSLTDGSVLIGRVSEAGDPFRFVMMWGSELQIPLANVRSISRAGGTMEGGEYWPEDPNRTRLFFGPTARTVPRGTGYLAVYELFFPFLGFGLTDSFVIAGGTPLFSMGEEGRPFWIAPKLKIFDSGKTQVALGALAFFITEESESAGLLYGAITRGSPSSSFTAGIGWAYWEEEIGDTPALMFGGEVRTSRWLKLVTENYFFHGEGAILSLGPRFFGRRLTADLGLAFPISEDMDGPSFFPLINFVYNF